MYLFNRIWRLFIVYRKLNVKNEIIKCDKIKKLYKKGNVI